jgi:hypothetical protein
MIVVAKAGLVKYFFSYGLNWDNVTPSLRFRRSEGIVTILLIISTRALSWRFVHNDAGLLRGFLWWRPVFLRKQGFCLRSGPCCQKFFELLFTHAFDSLPVALPVLLLHPVLTVAGAYGEHPAVAYVVEWHLVAAAVCYQVVV